jgi:hypothetical protein
MSLRCVHRHDVDEMRWIHSGKQKEKPSDTLIELCNFFSYSFSYIDAQVVSVSFSFMAQVSCIHVGRVRSFSFFFFDEEEEEEKRRWRTTKGNDMDVLNFLRASL